jgi:hypothetical protein
VDLLVEKGNGELVEARTGPFSTNLFTDFVEHVTVAGQPGVLLHASWDEPDFGPDSMWTLVWRPTSDAVGTAVFDAPNRASAEAIVAAIHEVPPEP